MMLDLILSAEEISEGRRESRQELSSTLENTKSRMTEAEVLRVLVPRGTADFNGKIITKPVPANIDVLGRH